MIIRAANPYDAFYNENLRIAKQQIEMCQGEFEVQLYCWLYWNGRIDVQVGEAVEQALGNKIWLDCEEDTQGRSPIDVWWDIGVALGNLTYGQKGGIYTRRGWWTSYTRPPSFYGTFRDEGLWDASPDGLANFDYWETHKYGGWDMPVMKQYGSEILGGVEVDVNVYKL